MAKKETNEQTKEFAVTCQHCIDDNKPYLYASRDEPLEEGDSGWQFLCGACGHTPSNARVISVQNVLRHDPGISALLSLPTGTRLSRSKPGSAWLPDPA
jgi:hypothetical protein